jgi:serine/threonine protein kinase/tetratricopeptide (TPR) repeat protein
MGMPGSGLEDVVVQFVCRTCMFSTTVSSADGPGTCPTCGGVLYTASETQTPLFELPDEQLIADIREAFPLSAAGAASFWPGDSEGLSLPDDVRLGALTLAAGSRLDDFEILHEVGRGGMGIVYRARQGSLNRDVALKVLPATLGRGESAVRRFHKEAQAVARLKHPNVVPIYAQGEHNGHLYYAMELVEGLSLDVAIHSRPELLSSTFWRSQSTANTPEQGVVVSEPETGSDRLEKEAAAPPPQPPSLPRTLEDFRHMARLVADVADGLAHAWDQGVIHRDIKPHNLLLGFDGRLHITDFGLAHLADEPHVTVSGAVMGTPAYLSPEQVRGDARSVDHRTDIYSLGATLYELMTHRRPFDGGTRDQILTGITTREPTSPRSFDRRIPRDLETICQRAMEKDPARRYPTAAAMAEDLRRFADGRPILARRARAVERGVKWVRRHRALAATCVAVAAVAALSGGLFQSVRSARTNQAANLVQTAYEQLAYLDYHAPELVEDSVDRAASLGADPVELGLTRALLSLGHSENQTAVDELLSVLPQAPEDPRVLYMLAWAQWRSGNEAASIATFDQAESLGGPATPDAWFFRGLAGHFRDADLAVESYRRANALRAAEHAFYPQAILHLARAHNQRMYVSRTLENFSEADASLQQLVDHEHYGAYPYYLLSIAHRLAADVYERTGIDADLATAGEHYEAALDWALWGQEKDPASDRPVTAEAECLEHLGRYDEAIAARTRAIGLAVESREQWEGHHYRWRLYYWTGQYDAALADLQACAGFSPSSRFYAYVYPAWVLAEMGEVDQASELAWAPAVTDPTDVEAVLWSAATLRLIGRPDEADELLGTSADSVEFSPGSGLHQTAVWLEALYALSRGETDVGELVSLAGGVTASRKALGEAYFHAGVLALGSGDRARALEHMTESYRSFDGELGYTYHATVIRKKLLADPGWPTWLSPPPAGAEPQEAQVPVEE